MSTSRDAFYLQISSANLPHYFAHASIAPANFFRNKIEDIQNLFSDHILLSKLKWNSANNCCVEIVKSDLEQFETLSENYFLFNSALPISRIRKIYFDNSEQMETTVWNINEGAAFIPQNLVELIDRREEDTVDTEEYECIKTKMPIVPQRPNLQKLITYFDKILGGISFMKIATTDLFDSNINLSKNYLSILSFFNDSIRKETELKTGDIISNDYYDLFKNKATGRWKILSDLLYSDASIEKVEMIAKAEKIHLKIKFDKILYEDVDPESKTYLAAILSTYGPNQSMSVDNFFSNLLAGKINNQTAELICFFLGMHNGYADFRNSYRSSGVIKKVKFELNAKIQYYTIESIYQYVFHSKKISSSFIYLESIIASILPNKKIPDYRTISILDSIFFIKKKEQFLSPKYFKSLLEDFNFEKFYLRLINSLQNSIDAINRLNKIDNNKESGNEIKKVLQILLLKYSKEIKVDFDEIELANKRQLEILGDQNMQLNKELDELKTELARKVKELESLQPKILKQKAKKNTKKLSKQVIQKKFDL